MLFTSYEFLFVFLPVALAGFALLRRHGWGNLIIYWLALCSMAFYGWWSLRALGMLTVSVTGNYLLAGAIRRTPAYSSGAYALLALGVTANLAVLALFKYAGFFAGSLNALLGSDMPILGFVLPLGISFFTFQQIIYLVDTYRGKVGAHRFADYFSFITFFPHLIAGPLIHQGDVLPQFAARRFDRVSALEFSRAVTIFGIGLAKKVLIADSMAAYATPVFSAAAASAAPTLIEAWCGALAYTLQLYFDFSGYSDMAIGLAAMFGVVLPLNFYSPYKARSIIDFWRRWHMTLSHFLRDYLYVPMGGNRHGTVQRYVNLMLVMLIGGLWHGAAWTFVAWGALHGAYLCINHFWHHARAVLLGPGIRSTCLTRSLAWSVTFIAVVVGWVFFRADNWAAVNGMLSGMAGINGVVLPETYARLAGPAGPLLAQMGVRFESAENLNLFFGLREILALASVLLVALALPNSVFWVTGRQPSFASDATPRRLPAWAPSSAWAVALGSMLVAALLMASRPTEFLYFQF